jgi:HAD domain in Swiss Army Knife RNA repair proteins
MAGVSSGGASQDAGARGSGRPLLMVDIDGVISLFGAPPADAEEPERAEGFLHSIDGMVHFLSATAAAHLLELARLYDLVWASGWEERADEHLPRLLGLPAGLPHLSFSAAPERSSAHWKLEAVERFAADRPLAWIDDCFNDACHAWAAQRRSPTLLVRTDARRGLTAREAQQLAAWAGEADTAGTAAQGPGAARVSGAGIPFETAAP